MQNWKPFINLGQSAAAGSAGHKTQKLIGHRTLNSVKRNLSTQQGSKSPTSNSKGLPGSVKRMSAQTISSSRKQSTTGANLAATHASVLRNTELLTATADGECELDKEAGEVCENVEHKSLENLLFAEGIAQEPLETHRFVRRHIGPRQNDVELMLGELGYNSMEALIEDTIPSQILLNRELRLPEPLDESELIEQLKEMGSQNEASEWKSYIGMGYYDCVTPPVILRNLFENPGWTTAYTAYQAEIAQGRLESLMNYQTMVCDLTGLDVANASLLDESTAAAEAMQVCLRYSKWKRTKLLVSIRCHPQTRAVVETRAQALGVQVDYFDELEISEGRDLSSKGFCLNDYAGLLIQYPNSQGYLFDLNKITSECRKADCLVAVATDLMACALYKPPGDFEEPADLAVGSSQRLGVPLNYGGPHAGFMACAQKLVRSMPGRVVGVTRDSSGQQAYRFALQTREQHIRRDKATSNICTAQALLANMSAMYAVYHGPEGLREIANQIQAKTSLLAHLIKKQQQQFIGDLFDDKLLITSILNDGRFFDTLTLRVNNQSLVKQRAHEAKINLRYDGDEKQPDEKAGTISISLDETTKLVDVFKLANLFNLGQEKSERVNVAPTNSGNNVEQPLASVGISRKLASEWLASPFENENGNSDREEILNLKRTTPFLTHPVFNTYRSEAQLVRYMKKLENKDISLTHSMIPLGSCTMKLNSTSQMMASSWPEFTKCHPFQPIEQCLGYQRLFAELDRYLCEITGYDRISFQPNSGAQGEYAGLRTIKAYLESKGQLERNVCLIPISAHGTNPASAQMAGFQIQTIKVREGDGNIDLEDLRKNIERFREQLACLMITYPSTYGVFEEGIREMCDLVHEAGGQVYLDGANMNAQVGLCRPGDYGSDVSHLNLHKTFCIPHGGGGPGAGPIGVKSHLVPFLPSHPLIGGHQELVNHSSHHQKATTESSQSFGTISSSMWGSPAILPISWSYIRLMSNNLKLSSQVAILNANYMRKKLENHYKILFKGAQGNVAHEFILDCRPFKKSANIEAIDIAKRLQDFGLHAPTVSWPVSNTLMLEPTESEDKDQLDNYCEALLVIRREIEAIESGKMDRINNPIKNAPHTQKVVCSSHWNRPYSREQAAFPASFVTPSSKLWPSVGRVDDTYGDTNLFCSCPPVEGSLAGGQ